MTPQRIRVSQAQDAYWAFDPFAVVRPGDDWYVDLSEYFPNHRYGLGARLLNHLRPAPNAPEFVQLAVIGQSGVGKTTQVLGAISAMPPKQVFPVMVDAMTEFDPADLDFADILFTLARSVLLALKEEKIDVPETEAELIEQYFADEVYVQSTGRSSSAEVTAEATAEGGVPFVAKLLARFRGSVKSESDYRREIRREVQRDPKELIRRVNLLLDAATKAVRRERKADNCRLLLVVDNLEKFENRAIVERAVVGRAGELRNLRCHLVAFLHPADQYAPRIVSAAAAFQKVITLPALPVRKRSDDEGHVDAECVNAVCRLLDRRVDVDALFEEGPSAVETLLRLSGGHLRDLLAIAREACEMSRSPTVSIKQIEGAARNLSRIHNAKIRRDDWPRLRQISSSKDISNDPVDAYLLLHLIVLEYNGEVWWDLHPYARMDKRFPIGPSSA